MLGHLPDNLLGKCPGFCGCADQHVGLDELDGLEKVAALAGETWVILCVGLLGVRQVLGLGGKQTRLVNETAERQMATPGRV